MFIIAQVDKTIKIELLQGANSVSIGIEVIYCSGKNSTGGWHAPVKTYQNVDDSEGKLVRIPLFIVVDIDCCAETPAWSKRYPETSAYRPVDSNTSWISNKFPNTIEYPHPNLSDEPNRLTVQDVDLGSLPEEKKRQLRDMYTGHANNSDLL